MPTVVTRLPAFFLVLVSWLSTGGEAGAHHVLGRPAYALNENSNTPPSMQLETVIGDYFVNYMVFPAFPRPKEPGRIHLYAKRIDNQNPLQEKVTFKVRDNSWAAWLGISANEETLGIQPPDDNVYRQGFVFSNEGDYIVTAEFHAEGAPYIIDFPLRIGAPPPVGPLGITAVLILGILVTVSLIQRRRALTGIIRSTRDEEQKSQS
jgi:hypothetical protein